MEERKELRPKGNDLPEGASQDDLYDGLFRDIVSREIARRGGRDEGRTIVFEPIPGAESVAVGRPEDLERWRSFLNQDRFRYREIVLDRYPTDSISQQKLNNLILPRLGKARERFEVAELPIFGPALQSILESVDAIAESVGLPLEKMTDESSNDPGQKKIDGQR